ncbi:hypothetical protein CLV57_0622 [Mucilaginibacter auburnensis]|uniref:Uncharacterized protein n=1 Tax=Mucilaginibacter auburnensis TaxID=1457233 RepID=A0A2H9VS35_9SPHI|nr:hypothetical protein CLV57_0622 [Mucilaginibacter auburnensis]
MHIPIYSGPPCAKFMPSLGVGFMINYTLFIINDDYEINTHLLSLSLLALLLTLIKVSEAYRALITILQIIKTK